MPVDDSQSRPKCCRTLTRALTDERYPLVFDQNVSEAHLLLCRNPNGGSGGNAIIEYCPFCGAKLPESTRGELFTEVSDDDEKAILEVIRGCRTFLDLVNRLGQPTRTFNLTSGSGDESFVRQHDFESSFATAVLSVIERANGTIDWGFCGKTQTTIQMRLARCASVLS